MSKIISIHSFRGGTGKSSTTSNLAAQMALKGKKVAVIDTDIQSPGIHVLFGLQEDDMKYTLNDYLWGKIEVEEAAYDMSKHMSDSARGKVLLPEDNPLYLIPSSIKVGEIARVLREGYDVGLLNDGFHRLIEVLKLDVLLIDTHPGLNEETLLSIAISDALIIVLRPDQQDFQGTGVTVEVARKLDVPNLRLLVNKLPQVFDADDVKELVEKTYSASVGGIIPHSEEMMTLQSSGIFCLHYPDHAVTKMYTKLTDMLLEDK